jgi:GNAT superfamily N-acetyltransferase
MPEIRPMRDDDVLAAIRLSVDCFNDLARRRHEPDEDPTDPAVAALRYRRCLESDPGGAWVAEHDGALVACALAILRDGVWGLSLLVVHPGFQSGGLGREILARANAYANGARGRIVVSSPDPRAIRAYLRLGLEAHPCLRATGKPRGVAPADGVREGTLADIPFTEEVDRHVRNAAHGADLATVMAMGGTLLIAPGRGYATVRRGGVVGILAAYDEDGARDVLRTLLARAAGEQALVEWLSARQRWALDVCLEAGLEIGSDCGAVFLDGDVGPFSPYLPSGAFL